VKPAVTPTKEHGQYLEAVYNRYMSSSSKSCSRAISLCLLKDNQEDVSARCVFSYAPSDYLQDAFGLVCGIQGICPPCYMLVRPDQDESMLV
jgi:hypothetical protein